MQEQYLAVRWATLTLVQAGFACQICLEVKTEIIDRSDTRASVAPASPPDVRQGCALPFSFLMSLGYALVRALPLALAPKAESGHSPTSFFSKPPAGQSPASHRAAKP